MLFSRSTGTMPRPLGIAQHDPRAPRSSKRCPVSSACSRNYRTMSSSRGSLSSSKALREPKEVAALRRAKFRGCSPWKAAFRFGLELVPAVQRAAQRRKLRLSSRNGDSTDSHRDAGKRRPTPNRTVVAPASAFLFGSISITYASLCPALFDDAEERSRSRRKFKKIASNSAGWGRFPRNRASVMVAEHT